MLNLQRLRRANLGNYRWAKGSALPIGQALVASQKCFCFDEPLSNLDAKLRVQFAR